jgi:5S rRNA maturation endonuclease (ribonuclease M5)
MIVVEGNSDKLLIKTMGFAKKMIHQAGNKGNVFKKVRNLQKL